MARRAFKLPDIGEGVVEGEVVTWHVEVGASVSEDDSIVDIMTDKSTVTIPSPYSGVVVALHGEIGDMVAVGAVLVEFDSEGEADDSPPASEESVQEEVPDVAKTVDSPARVPEVAAVTTPPPMAKASTVA
ncbi:MAG: branched-chain alpha-keto acid dehydrogenase subunit E2, partial [Euryarchaeota archaeon]|nr:branched-chain alpha-keto acid dehydrogenase subunit E2 [Euryarchaeota archaeon]